MPFDSIYAFKERYLKGRYELNKIRNRTRLIGGSILSCPYASDECGHVN